MKFDPYETWLGIPADRRPPTHYDLLGLSLFEADPATIDQAALRRMSKVRQHQLGPQSDVSQEVLAELARARLILMDPDRRADYDAKLLARGEGLAAFPVSLASAGNGDAPRGRSGPDEDAPGTLASLVLTERPGGSPSRLPRARDEGPAWWKRGLVIGAVVASHAALFAAFYFSILGPWLSNRKASDIGPVNPGPPILKQKPKPPAPQPKPVIPPKPAPPPIVQTPQADPPGRGSESPTPSVVTPPERDKDADGPPGLQQAGPQGTQADTGGGIAASNGKDATGQDSPEAVLAKHGLRLHGTQYLLESETHVLDKKSEELSLALDLKKAQILQQYTPGPEDRRQAINDQQDLIDQCDAEIRAYDLQMGQIRLGPGGAHANNLVAEGYRELNFIRGQYATERDWHIRERNFLSRPFDPQPKRKVDDLVRQNKESYDRARRDYGKLVDETVEKTIQEYKELDKNEEIKRALDTLGKKGKVRPKLGPSPEFNQIARQLEEVQKMKKRNPKE